MKKHSEETPLFSRKFTIFLGSAAYFVVLMLGILCYLVGKGVMIDSTFYFPYCILAALLVVSSLLSFRVLFHQKDKQDVFLAFCSVAIILTLAIWSLIRLKNDWF